jgi:periplasmic protein TonB
LASLLGHSLVLVSALVLLERTTPPRPLGQKVVALQFVPHDDVSQTPASPSSSQAAAPSSAAESEPVEHRAEEPPTAAAEAPADQAPPPPLEVPQPAPEPAATEPSRAPAEHPAVETKPKIEPPTPRPTEPPKPRARFALRPPSRAADAASGETTTQAAAAIGPMLPAHPVAGMESDRPPVYPEVARRRGQQGRVLLQVNVSANGVPVDVTVAQSSGFASLDDAALRAVEQWRFVPATRGGTAVPAVAEVPVRFRLTN